jgi:transglutaminase-like putative cysteine protease
VNFSDQTGGHAWVQVYDKGEWLELDPTTGPYYDDEEQKVVESDGVPFRYFARHDYPVLQTWKYFNDAYYWDVKKQEGNAPGSWKTKTGGSRAAVLD